jgi:hypothetical protein
MNLRFKILKIVTVLSIAFMGVAARDLSSQEMAAIPVAPSKMTKLVALNIDAEREQELILSLPAEEFTLTAPEPTSTIVMLNGSELRAELDGSVGSFKAHAVGIGPIRLAPSSVTFLTFPSAHNKSCK